MPNRLARESSPYLLQHANNPVDWHPWGEEAIAAARRLDRPIFLSIGYSACHWCHVMEHESFEDAAIAGQMNDGFVNVKVDREERPDLDQIYMHAVQLLTGRGGWPMSVFLTPDLKPFFGGTYWPPTDRHGLPGFAQVLRAVSDAWQNRRQMALEQAEKLTEHLRHIGAAPATTAPLDVELLRGAEGGLDRAFDGRNGGFGGAPKFPHPMDLRVLLRLWRRDRQDYLLRMATLTLDKMAAGGIYDQLGGGFHRYSVDAHWLTPHFEKMLYDNALLVGALVETYQATGNAEYAQVARETCDYILREMTDPAGGFYSTQDADSEGEEGKFYVWTPDEIEAVLGADAAKAFCRVYDVSDVGNFEGKNILNRPKTLAQCAAILGRNEDDLAAELADSRRKLLAVRNDRVWPGLDDKVLVSWNGLAIDALAQAAGAFDEPRYAAAAVKAAEFVLSSMRRPDGRLLHSWRKGQARFDAYLDDYACLTSALVSLYEATFDERWIEEALRLADTLLALFADPAGGGFFYTAHDHESLIARAKDVQDSSVPSGNAMAATALVRLGELCGRNDYLQAAEGVLAAYAGLLKQAPLALGQMLIALDLHIGPAQQIVVAGDGAAAEPVLRELRTRFWPNRVLARRDGSGVCNALDPLFSGKDSSEPTLFVCERYACKEPARGDGAIRAAIDSYAPR